MGSLVLLDLMGGVALLLWGLHMVRSGILRAFGADLRSLLAKALKNRFAAFVAGWFSERGWGSHVGRALCGMLIALAVIYAGGWSWLAVLTGPRAAFTMGVAPFVVADIIKVAIGAALLPYTERLVARLS